MASSHLNWLIVRDHNSFMLKQRNIPKPFSKEQNNLMNVSTFRYSGIVHPHTIGITPSVDKKGVIFAYKKAKKMYKPAESTGRITFKSGQKRTLKKVKNVIQSKKYRRDLQQVALKRVSAIYRSQKTKPAKKKGAAKKTE
ncbi:large ribosomal subunit protein eL28 [Chironomus tepperi]|uniref:large ribosomal subunit protein eL28 n=1 Tax=Chironomus tepperi TaxID=113505 RepID=UPI00391EF617